MNIYKRENSAACSLLCMLVFCSYICFSQSSADTSFFQQEKSYINPVLPGDHPDPTLLKVGDDFYHCGSSFHFNPYLPIYHSKDLVHWDIIGRVVPPQAGDMVVDKPGAGIWQGAITYFYGSYWVYFSAGGQWFSKADSPAGPWSVPRKMQTTHDTGPVGYDNSVFVDDDGKPYMVIKNGQKTNRIQAIGRDGNLTDTVINLDWVNSRLQYSWADGPVMCKRNGFYYYFMAGDVSGGQYVLKGQALSGDSTKWQRLGAFFKPALDPATRFPRPNHIAAPVQIADGTWWTIAQSYEHTDGDDWSGMGRQTSLYPVLWEGDRPWGMAPANGPITSPALKPASIPWRSAQSDYFGDSLLNPSWHFLNKKAPRQASLTARPGWMRLTPDSGTAHIMQKETDHYYSVVTEVDNAAGNYARKAGIYVCNGNQTVAVKLYVGYDRQNIVGFEFGKASYTLPVSAKNILYLKLERVWHQLKASYSADGLLWRPIGQAADVSELDRAQPDFNSWVGTSVGLFAEGQPADFDYFRYKDAYSPISVESYKNGFGVERITSSSGTFIKATTKNGGWVMYPGIDFGQAKTAKTQAELLANTTGGGIVECWLDNIGMGKRIFSIEVKPGNPTGKTGEKVQAITGSHDVYLRILKHSADMYIKGFSFTQEKN